MSRPHERYTVSSVAPKDKHKHIKVTTKEDYYSRSKLQVSVHQGKQSLSGKKRMDTKDARQYQKRTQGGYTNNQNAGSGLYSERKHGRKEKTAIRKQNKRKCFNKQIQSKSPSAAKSIGPAIIQHIGELFCMLHSRHLLAREVGQW